ncbi:related to TAM domain methyltransferase [Fusarium oxysporum]|uniref:Related to TAM domain methyltransferase n=1 Tax=Fusarium oxysporum TaxID=5507 RepID=A0A2H3TVA8_FUSOX|nr:related to TAM domain methyltransferase [Fusarium oxysporum]
MSNTSSPKNRSPRSPRSPQDPSVAVNETIAVDEPQDEGEDLTLGSDAESSTASISSSILNYRTINGRTFHSERGNAAYWGSNDERQSDAMDIAHHIWTLAHDGELYFAPLEDNIQKVLDVGTGTDQFCSDFADKFPGCEVIGTDISPIQPGWVPPNLKFEIEDCNQEWTFPSESFDYVHLRYLVGCIPDWTELFSQAYKTLKPGGWVESFEISPTAESDDGTVTYDSAMAQWGRIFVEASKKIGNSFTVVDDKVQRPALQEAGFVDIHEWEFKCPLNPWPKDPKLKEIGRFGELFLTQDTEGFVTLAANLLGWSMEEVYVYIAKFRREVRNRKHHVYIRLRAVWARKPETKEEPTPA